MIAAVVAGLALAGPAPADVAAAHRGAAWLAGQAAGASGGAEADAVLALVAARRPPASHLTRLRSLARTYALDPGSAAKTALAAEAAGADPRCFGGVDLVARIGKGYAAGIYGATIWDDALSIEALAGADEPVPPAAVRALERIRGRGGWSLTLSALAHDDADSTGLALMALRAAGVPPTTPSVRLAVRWLREQELPGGGWSGAAGADTDANSTGLALRGLVASGSAAPRSGVRALRALQRSDGSFAATPTATGSALLATVEAVPALLQRPLPLLRRSGPWRVC